MLSVQKPQKVARPKSDKQYTKEPRAKSQQRNVAVQNLHKAAEQDAKVNLPRLVPGPPFAKSHKEARDLISVEQHWLSFTKLLDSKRAFEKMFAANALLDAMCTDPNTQSVIVNHALSLGGRKECSDRVFKFIKSRSAPEQKELALAWLLVATHETRDGIFSLVERTMDRIHRCSSAQKQAYVLLVQQGSAYLANPPTTRKKAILAYVIQDTWEDIQDALFTAKTDVYSAGGGSMKSSGVEVPCAAREVLRLVQNKEDHARLEEALEHIHTCVADFMDDFKDCAYKSAIEEPARFYFNACGNTEWRDHVNVHGINWYLSMVRGAFGANCPRIPMDNEDDANGFADHWQGLNGEAWCVFSKPENFGKSFEGIRELRGRNPMTFVSDAGLAKGNVRSKARTFGGSNSTKLEERARQGDPKVLPYTARFAYFFRAEFFPKRLFEVLNAEHKPEQAGFRRACDDIFRNLFLFEKKNIPSSKLYSSREEDEKEDENEEKKAAEEDEAFEEGLLEWLYDDMMIELQLPRLLAFLAFLGIVKPVYNQF